MLDSEVRKKFDEAFRAGDIQQVTAILSDIPPNCVNNNFLPTDYRELTTDCEKVVTYYKTLRDRINALHFAALTNNMELVELLVKHHADVHQTSYQHRMTAVHFALLSRPINIATLDVHQTYYRHHTAAVHFTLYREPVYANIALLLKLAELGANLDVSLGDCAFFLEISDLEYDGSMHDLRAGYFRPYLSNDDEQAVQDRLAYQHDNMKHLMRPVVIIASQDPEALKTLITLTPIPTCDIQFLSGMRKDANAQMTKVSEFDKVFPLLARSADFYRLFQALRALNAHGESLCQDSSSEQQGKRACSIAQSLETQAKAFIEALCENDKEAITKIQATFKQTLKRGFRESGDHRNYLKPILANLLIAATGVGIIIIGIKYLTDGQLFFSQTRRQEQIKAIEQTAVAALVS